MNGRNENIIQILALLASKIIPSNDILASGTGVGITAGALFLLLSFVLICSKLVFYLHRIVHERSVSLRVDIEAKVWSNGHHHTNKEVFVWILKVGKTGLPAEQKSGNRFGVQKYIC